MGLKFRIKAQFGITPFIFLLFWLVVGWSWQKALFCSVFGAILAVVFLTLWDRDSEEKSG